MIRFLSPVFVLFAVNTLTPLGDHECIFVNTETYLTSFVNKTFSIDEVSADPWGANLITPAPHMVMGDP